MVVWFGMTRLMHPSNQNSPLSCTPGRTFPISKDNTEPLQEGYISVYDHFIKLCKLQQSSGHRNEMISFEMARHEMDLTVTRVMFLTLSEQLARILSCNGVQICITRDWVYFKWAMSHKNRLWNSITPHVSDVPGVIVLTSSVRPSVCVSGCTQGTLCLSVCYHSHDRTDRHTDLNVHLLPEGGWIEKWGGLQKLLKVDEYRTTHSSDIDWTFPSMNLIK